MLNKDDIEAATVQLLYLRTSISHLKLFYKILIAYTNSLLVKRNVLANHIYFCRRVSESFTT